MNIIKYIFVATSSFFIFTNSMENNQSFITIEPKILFNFEKKEHLPSIINIIENVKGILNCLPIENQTINKKDQLTQIMINSIMDLKKNNISLSDDPLANELLITAAFETEIAMDILNKYTVEDRTNVFFHKLHNDLFSFEKKSHGYHFIEKKLSPKQKQLSLKIFNSFLKTELGITVERLTSDRGHLSCIKKDNDLRKILTSSDRYGHIFKEALNKK